LAPEGIFVFFGCVSPQPEKVRIKQIKMTEETREDVPGKGETV
jgi:hypothetical protein